MVAMSFWDKSLPGTPLPWAHAGACKPSARTAHPMRNRIIPSVRRAEVQSPRVLVVVRRLILPQVPARRGSMAVLHPAVLADTQALAVLAQLGQALLLGLSRLQAFRGVEVRLGHRPVVENVLLHVRRVVLLGLLCPNCGRRGTQACHQYQDRQGGPHHSTSGSSLVTCHLSLLVTPARASPRRRSDRRARRGAAPRPRRLRAPARSATIL